MVIYYTGKTKQLQFLADSDRKTTIISRQNWCMLSISLLDKHSHKDYKDRVNPFYKCCLDSSKLIPKLPPQHRNLILR